MRALRITCLAAGVITAFAGGGSLVQRVPPDAAKRENPFRGDERAQRAGAKLYVRECAPCHGPTRQGSPGVPPLILKEVQDASPGTLFWILRNGSLRRGMPSFAHLPEPQRWQIITFVQAKQSN